MPRRKDRLSRNAFAAAAGVSRQAVHYALQRGWLVATHDGKIDPTRRLNRDYLVRHVQGFDVRFRSMSTYRGRPDQEVSKWDAADLAAIDVAALLAELRQGFPAEEQTEFMDQALPKPPRKPADAPPSAGLPR